MKKLFEKQDKEFEEMFGTHPSTFAYLNFMDAKRQETLEAVREEIKSVPNEGHALGERPWCIKCNKRIQKHLLKALEQ